MGGLKKDMGRFDGIVNNKVREGSKGTRNVTTQRTFRVKPTLCGIIVSLCAHIHIDLPLYMGSLVGTLVSAVGPR